MKSISLQISTIAIILLCIYSITSCSKGSSSPPPNNTTGLIFKLDTNYYFKVNFSGKTLSSYSYVEILNGTIIYAGGADIIGTSSTATNNSIVTSTLGFIVSGSTLNIIYPSYSLPSNQCDFSCAIGLTKIGNAVGNYIYHPDQISFQISPMTLSDLTVGNKKYCVDTINNLFTVTQADTKFIKGTFSCNLIDGNSKIPATGSFSLAKQ